MVVALDLEQYDYRDGAQKLIRTTEGTDQSRLPPRIQVREKAPLETPHIMVLIDDPQQTVIEPLGAKDLKLTYDFELMLGGGRLRGWHIDDGALIDEIAGHIARLACGEPPMIYAMGDGNHSFATARAVWERLKAEAEDERQIMNHPARYALAELVNVHDEGLGVCANPSGSFWRRCGRSLAGNGDALHRVGDLAVGPSRIGTGGRLPVAKRPSARGTTFPI